MSATPAPRPGPAPAPRTAPRPVPRAAPASARAEAKPSPWRLVRWPLLGAVIVAFAWGVTSLASLAHPPLVPRHRAEALCFALAEPPAFAPPMAVECAAAMVRGRFGSHTPAGVAVREAMRLRADMVLQERRYEVGDFDVTVLWLRLPPGSGATYWMVLAWMEGSDLATSSFGFAGDEPDLTREQRDAGEQVLRRVLLPDHFRAGALPDVRWRAPRGQTLPAFGPAAAR